MMITQAESAGGRVDMHRFGDAACFVAEGLSAVYLAHRQFPGYTIAYKEADPGNGLWFVLLADHGKGSVRIYAIRQGVLPWNVPENTRVADAKVCTDTVEISTSSATGPGLFFKPAQQKPLIAIAGRAIAVDGLRCAQPISRDRGPISWRAGSAASES